MLFLPLLCCKKAEQQGGENWHTIRVGGYLFDFPSDFKLIEETGIDSYVGRVEGDSISFFFDYGEYSNELAPTPEEYFKDSSWVWNGRNQIIPLFTKPGKTYNIEELPKVEVLSIRKAILIDSLKWKGSDYVAIGRHGKYVFEFPIYLPQVTKEHNITIDTIDNHSRKIVMAKVSSNGITGIHIRPINSDKALTMVADSLTKRQQDLVAKILSTVRAN